MAITTWENLPKEVLDPTTIGQEVAAQIASHNDDPEAHLGDGQSLESHRAAEIIDHLAESVVNDKIHKFARSYVALVGTDVEGDFATIQSAVAYAEGVGGGTIFIAPGEYYLAGAVELPANINLYTADPEAVTVHGGYTGGNYFKIVDDSATNQVLQTFDNIKFVNDGGGVFHTTDSDLTYRVTQTFTDCIFDGGGQYIYSENINLKFVECTFAISSPVALSTGYLTTLDQCTVTRYGSASSCYLYENNGVYLYDSILQIKDSTLDASAATTAEYFTGSGESFLDLRNTTIRGWASNNNPLYQRFLIDNDITFKSNHSLAMGTDGNAGILVNNALQFAGTGKMTNVYNDYSIVGNYISGGYSGFDATAGVYADRAVGGYNVMGNGYTACDLGTFQAAQLTPNSTRTLTTTVPRAGERRTFIVLTSGTTSYTLTFGTGFKTTGTLATGATSARRFVVSFVSDGTRLIECSRTTAIA